MTFAGRFRVMTGALGLLGVLTAGRLWAEVCTLPSPTRMESIGTTQWLYTYELSVDPTFFQPATPSGTLLQRVRREIGKLIVVDPIALLRRQRDMFKEAFGVHTSVGYDLIIDGKVGSIRPIRCLEAQLFETHLSRQKTQVPETEFAAVILTKVDEVKIYQMIGQFVSPPGFEHIDGQVKADHENGWTLQAHLHNHPVFISNLPNGDVAGTLIPSGTFDFSGDIREYVKLKERYSLSEAWITNGFDTFMMSTDEISLLRSE